MIIVHLNNRSGQPAYPGKRSYHQIAGLIRENHPAAKTGRAERAFIPNYEHQSTHDR